VEAVFLAEASARNCWCQFHVLSNADAATTNRDTRRDLLRQQIGDLDPPRGLVAMDEGVPVGWCGVEPRTRLAHVLMSRLVAKNSPSAADDPGVWSIYCILVPPTLRRGGIGAVLLDEAIAHAIRSGATELEGYPIDTDKRGGALPPGFSTGTLAMFTAVGFGALAVLPSGRTLVRRVI